MSFKSSASNDTLEKTISKEGKSMIAPPGTNRSKECVVSERKVVTSKSTPSKSARTPVSVSAKSHPQPATKQTKQASEAAQTGRCSAPVKMPDRSKSCKLDKTLSNIVKVKHKKDNGLPVGWRKELYGTRPGSAQARLENLRAALQKEVDEQKLSKTTTSITIKRTIDQKNTQKEKQAPFPSTSQSKSASLTAVAATSAVPKVETVKHTDAATKDSFVEQTNTRPVTVVIEKHGNIHGMEVDGVETNSPEPEISVEPAEHNGSSFGRYNASAKIPDRSTSTRSNKMLSSIMKVKHKKDNGLPVAWRNDLYGTRPGSAQARLENFRATLQKEIEEQNISKTATSIPIKRSGDQKSPTSMKITPSPSQSSSNVTASSADPKVPVIKHNEAVPEILIVKANSPTPAAINTTENLEDSCDMDVDEASSPEPAVSFPPAVPASSKSMEYDNFGESKMEGQNTTLLEEVKPNAMKKTTEETNDDSHQVTSDLKTKYKDGLSAFANYFYCVIDTNIFIENYNNFQGFLSKKYSGSQPIVVVPYKVLHELDMVKHKKPQLGPKITPVVKFLHQMLRAKDARVKGQHPWDDTIELMPVHSPDDSIINCALQVQSVASGNVKVVLVSNDCNMLTKAIVANLSTCTMEELQSDYKF